MTRRRVRRIAAVALAAAAVSGCSHAARPTAASTSTAPVVVASFNFSESELLAEIYAQALRHAGVPVTLELDVGPREMVLPGLHQGLIDFVPEYVGSAVAALDPGAQLQGASAADEGRLLADALRPWHVEVRPPASAQNQNGLAVTRDTADLYHLTATSDLGPIAGRLTLAGPTECPTRPFCLEGFRSVYGLRFAHFVAYDSETARVTALDQHVVDVAVMFTTDGELATGDFALLADDRHLQPAENVIPLVSERAATRYGPRLTAAVDAVSARLTTPDLEFLNWRVGVAGKPVAAEATGWLRRHGLLPPG